MSQSVLPVLVLIVAAVGFGCGKPTSPSNAFVPDNQPDVARSQPESPTREEAGVATESACATRRDGVDFHFRPIIAPPSDEPAVSISSAELVDYTLSDWAGAHDKWSGQLLEVRGLVGGTTCTLDGLECMHLVSEQAASDIALECVVARGTWLKCRQGQTARVRGYWDPFALSPRLLSVQIIEVTGDSAAIEMDVETFRGLIAADFEAARERFRNKRIILRGPITAIEPHVPPMDGVTAENAPYGYLGIGEAKGLTVNLFACYRPGRNVLAHRNLRLGDPIIASFPITDLADNQVGSDRIETLNTFVALQVESPVGDPGSNTSAVAMSATETIHHMTSVEFAAMCEQHLRETKTLISTEEYEITGRLSRFDPSVVVNARLNEGPDHTFGVKCYLATGGNWTVALPGQTVTLRGRLFPEGTLTDSLLDCRIISVTGCPRVYSIQELKDFVTGTGKVNDDLHMFGVAVQGKLSRTSTDEWQLRSEGSHESSGIMIEFGAEYQPASPDEDHLVQLCGKIMRKSDKEFYLNDCILLLSSQ